MEKKNPDEAKTGGNQYETTPFKLTIIMTIVK